MLDNVNNNDVSTYSVDMQFENNNNNNESLGHRIDGGKTYDSGLEIYSLVSEESVSNAQCPNMELKDLDHDYATLKLPIPSMETISPKKTWNSLCIRNDDIHRKGSLSRDGIIELKTLNTNNNMSTSIVIFRNKNREFRHINIIDYREKHISKVRNDSKKESSSDIEMFDSTNNLSHDQISQSTVDLCNYLSQNNSLSDLTGQKQNTDLSNRDDTKKASTKILDRLASTFCCRKHMSSSENSEDENEPAEDYPDWKFSVDEFDDITYLSSGAQGTIYTTKFRDKIVALKKVKSTIKKDEVHIEHLLVLCHKNVIKYLGVCEEPENYLVMEYCSLGQLFDCLHRSVEISPQDVRVWAYQICDGMAYLHKNDIIHRDLKSPNILLSDGNVLKIIDFENGKDCCESKILNSFVGTIAWMAPEVLREEVHTKKIDVWSYGVVLWEMITREIPYCGIEAMSILYGVGNNYLSLPLCTSIPCEIKDLLSRCWEKSSEKRPSFQDIIDRFDYYFNNLEHFSLEQFVAKQLEWKKEIDVNFQEINKETISTTRVETELIRRRTKELNDAKNFKELYSEKLRRADKLIALLNKCLNVVEDEKKKNESEWKLLQKLKQSISPSLTTQDNNDPFMSLPFRSAVKNIRLPTEMTHTTSSPRKNRVSNQHSMLEQGKTSDKYNDIKRKHSAHCFRERNHIHAAKTKVDIDWNSKNKKTTRSPPKKTVSLETVTNEKPAASSLNTDVLTKKTEKTWINKFGTFSTMPYPNKSSLFAEDVSGTVNPSFQGSGESFTNLRDLQMTNPNLLNIAYFGSRASITDINNSHENLPVSINPGQHQSIFRRSLLEESISECHPIEEGHNMDEISEEIPENGNVLIREISGRAVYSSKNVSLRDSFDVEMLNSEMQTPYSLIEKEVRTQCLIRPHGFLARVNTDTSSDNDTIHNNHERDRIGDLSKIMKEENDVTK